MFARTPMKNILVGVSVSKLADITGLSDEYLKDIKSGRNEPRDDLRSQILIGIAKLTIAPNNTDGGAALQELVKSVINRIQPLSLSRIAKVGLKTIYRILNGETVKLTTANKLTIAIEEFLSVVDNSLMNDK